MRFKERGDPEALSIVVVYLGELGLRDMHAERLLLLGPMHMFFWR
jgi:hypothetical protein